MLLNKQEFVLDVQMEKLNVSRSSSTIRFMQHAG